MKKYILHSLASGPKTIERLLRVFPKDRLDERKDSSRLTPREAIAHLADFERTHLDRIRSANKRPGTTLERIDLKQLAVEHHYSDKDVFHEAEVLESRRGLTIDYLYELSDEDLHKPLKTPDGEEINILEYAASIVSYDMLHLEQLSEFLANGAATHS